MAKLNITQAAKAVGKDRTTLQRNIKKGKVTCEVNSDGNKVIDTAELIRAYGEIRNVAASTAVGNDNVKPQHAADNTALFQQQINLLETQIKVLEEDREERRDREKELRELLKTRLLEYQPTQQSTSNSILFALCLLSSILMVFLAVVFFYRG